MMAKLASFPRLDQLLREIADRADCFGLGGFGIGQVHSFIVNRGRADCVDIEEVSYIGLSRVMGRSFRGTR